MIYKSYIDGFRALSIISVVTYHAFPNLLPGGYIGVDFFFVISGYLITGILLEKFETNQPIFFNFYARRIKRLFPALILIFIFCYVVGWFFLLANEFKELNQHIFWGTIFLSNFRLFFDIGYFDQSSNLKPLLHLWSLSIEEQFYLVWPIFLYFLKGKTKLFFGVFTFTLISLLACLLLQYVNQGANFYLPITRFWELSAGAILLLFERKKLTLLNKNISPIFLCGLIFLTFSPLFIFTHDTRFPGFSSLWPVSFFLVLFYLTNEKTFIYWNSFLSNRVMVFIGKISYPLYLWHWVFLSLATIIFSERSTQITLIAIALSFILSVLTYLMIENPIQKMSNWFSFVLILVMAVIAGMSYSAYSRGGLEFRYQKLVNIPESFKRDFVKWENKGMQPEGNCELPFHFPNKKICVNGVSLESPRVVVIGDSHAFSAYWGLSKILNENGVEVSLTGKGACLPYGSLNIKEVSSSCAPIIDHQLKYIANKESIKKVIFSHRYAYLSDQSTKETFEKFEISMAQTFDMLLRANKQIIFLMPVPELRFDPRLCVGELPLGRSRPKNDCSYSLESELDRQFMVRQSILNILKHRPEIVVYEPSNFICPEGNCSLLIDGKIVFMDDNHLSESGSILQAVDLMNKISLSK